MPLESKKMSQETVVNKKLDHLSFITLKSCNKNQLNFSKEHKPEYQPKPFRPFKVFQREKRNSKPKEKYNGMILILQTTGVSQKH